MLYKILISLAAIGVIGVAVLQTSPANADAIPNSVNSTDYTSCSPKSSSTPAQQAQIVAVVKQMAAFNNVVYSNSKVPTKLQILNAKYHQLLSIYDTCIIVSP